MMKIGFWNLLLVLVPFVFSTAFGVEDDPQARQEQWARQHTTEPRIIEVANPHTISFVRKPPTQYLRIGLICSIDAKTYFI